MTNIVGHNPVGGEVLWRPEDAPKQEMSADEKQALDNRMKALSELLKTKKKATYKIEILFGKARSMHRPTPGIVSFWESGSKLHGGGDAKLYICPGKSLGVNDCQAFIPDDANGSGFHFCLKCGQKWKGEQAIGEYMNNISLQKWAEAILGYYRRLDHDADIYVKHSPEDIRYQAAEAQARAKGIEMLEKVRRNRAPYIYTLHAIIKDTSAGADLLGRFYAFLTA